MQNYNPDDVIARLKKPPKMATFCLIFGILMFILAMKQEDKTWKK